MSQNAAHSLDRQPIDRFETLWVTDKEMIARLGMPAREAKQLIHEFDRDPRQGFPQKQKLYGDRRYWPAIRAFFDALYQPKIKVSPIRRDR